MFTGRRHHDVYCVEAGASANTARSGTIVSRVAVKGCACMAGERTNARNAIARYTNDQDAHMDASTSHGVSNAGAKEDASTVSAGVCVPRVMDRQRAITTGRGTIASSVEAQVSASTGGTNIIALIAAARVSVNTVATRLNVSNVVDQGYANTI